MYGQLTADSSRSYPPNSIDQFSPMAAQASLLRVRSVRKGMPVDSDAAVTPGPIPTTRRAVLRTGVKFAYAAPVVAASMTLARQTAEAQVSGPCTALPDASPCSSADQCCSGICEPHNQSFPTIKMCGGICRATNTACDINNPGECCSLCCRTDGVGGFICC